MNYFDLYSTYPDRTIAAAWDSHVNEAAQMPGLAQILLPRGSEFFARFAACYAELRALPRNARRALQRQLARSTEIAAILPEYLQQGGRRLQHRMAWSLAGAALLLALGQGVATAATITVTTSNPTIAVDGQCSLVEAIINANNDAATHADCAAGNAADTIVLPQNANITLSNAYGTLSYTTYSRPVGLPPIASRITIEGNGAIISRQANAPDFGLLAVNGSGDLGLQGVTISRGGTRGGASNSGKLNIQSSIISGNVGRGISSFGGTVTIANSTIVGNTAGGIYSRYAVLTIENSTISGNTANYFGGGVSTAGGTIAIVNSTLSGNFTGGFGGGVSNGIGYGDGNPILLTITNSTISGNTANDGGGGVSNHGGTIAIVNSTISNNVTLGSGGGISNEIGYGGPGLFTIANSTISGNRANEGGGVFNEQICFGALGGCASAAVTLNHSLIAGNEAASGREITNQSNNFTANNFNLFGSNGNAGISGFTPGPTDIVPNVPLAQILSPLQNNGGPTLTHALVDGSPALDAGDPSGCQDNSGALLQTDQRGFARHIDGNNDGSARCDIGAYELFTGPNSSVVAAVLPSSRSVQVGGVATAFAMLINTGQSQAVSCSIAPVSGVPAAFFYQTTDPATNQLSGLPNTPANIAAGAAQSFVIALTPTAPIAPTDVQFEFACANTTPAPITTGLNTLLLSASNTPVPDIVALAATVTNDGIVNIPGATGTGVFAVATVNVGAPGIITASADTGTAILPVNVSLCQTDPGTEACISAISTSVATQINANETPTFGIFLQGNGNVPFDPAGNRVFVRFTDGGGVTRGSTSVAVRTQ